MLFGDYFKKMRVVQQLLLLSAAPFLCRICCRSVERWQKAHSFASFGLCVGFVRLANVCACAVACSSPTQ